MLVLNDVVKVLSVDNASDLKDVFTKIDKLGKLLKDASIGSDLIRYLSGMTKISMKVQIYNALLKKAYVSQIMLINKRSSLMLF